MLSRVAWMVVVAWALGTTDSRGFALGAEYRLAVFSADVTVPVGHPMMGGGWRARRIEDQLEARGLVLLGPDKPIVYIALDWCEVRGAAYEAWQEGLAKSAGTDRERVIVTAIHQHDAPVADVEAEAILRERGLAGSVCDPDFHAIAVERCARALAGSLADAKPLTHIGCGQAVVHQLASNRRYEDREGIVRFDRMSRSTSDGPRDADEGVIDPWLKRISFWNGDEELASVSVYAVHPMSYYGQGDVSADFPGIARRRHQADKPGTLQIYASGCSGNVTAGKYNAGTPGDRLALAERLADAMKRAADETERYPLETMTFRSERLAIPPRDGKGFTEAELEETLRTEDDPFRQCLAAMGLAWRRRCDAGKTISLPEIDFGRALWLTMPGETYVEYQLAAQEMNPGSFVLVTGYGEAGTGYIPTDRHWDEGDSNLSDWCWVDPGAEGVLVSALRSLRSGRLAEAPREGGDE